MNTDNCEIIHFYDIGSQDLPKDYRKLLQTPKYVNIVPAAGGHLWYNGIEKNLLYIFSKLDKDLTIEMNFNVDGLPIFKSTTRSFWPILANIHGNKCIQLFCLSKN